MPPTIGLLAELANPRARATLKAVQRPGIIDVRFVNAAVDIATVTPQSVEIVDDQGRVYAFNASLMPGNVVRFLIDGLSADRKYTVRLSDAASPIMSEAGAQPAHALDGELRSVWPTGNRAPGGTYVFRFDVV